ncbi:MAG: Lipid A export permease/ATP-binding protein MsbA [Pseudolabrys sp.]|jgi:ATP-binding cassette subfamily B protein|nr:Lipid A export permease/ATP-binding protein MsbA [Pseudolabrys sp.]
MNKFLLPASADKLYTAWPLIRRLLSEEGTKHWKSYAFAFALMSIFSGCTAAIPWLFGQVINQAQVHRSMDGVIFGSVLIFLLFAFKGLAGYGQAVVLARIANSIIGAKQREVFAKLLHENLGFFSDRHSSEFITRLTAGASAIAQILNLMITSIGRDLFSLVGLAGVMIFQDPLMSLSAMIIAPPALLLVRKLIKKVRKIARDQYHGSALILETLQETLHGIRVVKAFTLEDTMRERFDRYVNTVRGQANKMARVANRTNPVMEMLGGLALALVSIYGGYRTVVEGIAPGEFFSFMAAFLMAYEPAKRLARFNMDLNNGLVGARLMLEIIDTPATEPEDAGKPALRPAIDRIEFSGVTFAYRGEDAVLRDMSFVAEPGKMTALVGPSGGGKSTVFNLLLRFYDLASGAITIGGQNIEAVTRQSLRHHIGYVGQDAFLFRGTIRDNIAYGRPGASEAEIMAAAKNAYAHDFIMSLPQQYDTEVGEHGMQLSGGQRQRVAIARALIKDAPVILLDEPTAALDSESELLVREAIARLCENRTTLVIAHRLHTIAHADRIHVVEGGHVVESGRHDELLRKGGRYATFYRLQLQQQEIPEPIAANL